MTADFPTRLSHLHLDSIRRQDPNIYSDTETRALSRLGCYSGGSAGLLGRPRVFTIQK